ncbi:MAG: hypothetical protein MHM6MM_004268 [Cercozoa sp. M6MM]
MSVKDAAEATGENAEVAEAEPETSSTALSPSAWKQDDATKSEALKSSEVDFTDFADQVRARKASARRRYEEQFEQLNTQIEEIRTALAEEAKQRHEMHEDLRESLMNDFASQREEVETQINSTVERIEQKLATAMDHIAQVQKDIEEDRQNFPQEQSLELRNCVTRFETQFSDENDLAAQREMQYRQSISDINDVIDAELDREQAARSRVATEIRARLDDEALALQQKNDQVSATIRAGYSKFSLAVEDERQERKLAQERVTHQLEEYANDIKEVIQIAAEVAT